MPTFFRPRRASRFSTLLAVCALAACSKGDGGTGTPQPASVQSVTTTVPSATVGAGLATSPTFTVKDAGGSVLSGIPVSVVVSSGGGTLTGAPTRTSSGATSVGTWTLGTAAGTQTLTVTVSGVAPLTISATALPGNPAKVIATAGSGQTGLAGATLAVPLEAQVQDQFGNGVPNVQYAFQQTSGGGSFTPSQGTTDANGKATGVLWKLGNVGGPQSAIAAASGFQSNAFTATIQSTFPLDLRFFGPPMSAEAQQAFTNAANRIRAAIIAEVNVVPLNNFNLFTFCGLTSLQGTLNETTKGVIIYAGVAPIDGPGKVLANAGPCAVRSTSKLPLLGVMQFDEADIQTYIASGRFEAIVLHEMNHVLGVGTIWTDLGLLSAPVFDIHDVPTGSVNPRFTGANAVAKCQQLGGTASHCTGGVAVEYSGGVGTADGHWRESFSPGIPAFDTELMTGFVEATPVMPWSAMTIASFQDLGYTVNYLAADNFAVPNLVALARISAMTSSTAASLVESTTESVMRPRYEVSSGGVGVRINREKK